MRRREWVATLTLHGPYSQLITLRNLPEAGPISDGALEIIAEGGIRTEEGVITEVGSWKELRRGNEPPTCEEPVVALPGFVDCHTHLCWGGSRSRDYALRLSGATYQEIAAAGGGIRDTMKQTRAASEEELRQVAEANVKQLYRGGIRTAEVKSGYGLTVEDECKMLRAVRGARSPVELITTCLAAHIPPPEATSAVSYLEELVANLLPKLREEQLSNRIDIFVEENAFSVEEARPYLLKAKELGFDLTLHADQFSRGGAKLAAEMGARSADHLEVSDEEDLIALRESGVVPVVLPGCSLGLGIPFAPARRAVDLGLPLAIASDWNPGSAPQGDLLTQAALMGAAEKLTMAETFAAITERAARALGLSDRAVVARGKKALLTLFPATDYRDILYYQGSLRPLERAI